MRLDEPKDKETIQAVMNEGMKGDFWKLIREYLDIKIEVVRNEKKGSDLRLLPAEEYKVSNEIMNSREQNFEDLKDIPETIIRYVESPDQTEPEFDPYARG